MTSHLRIRPTTTTTADDADDAVRVRVESARQLQFYELRAAAARSNHRPRCTSHQERLVLADGILFVPLAR